MNWTPRHTLVAGLALILGTNAVVLAGVAYNRGGEPEARLRLTERELAAPHSWGFERENSGLAMRLQWRVAAPRAASDDSVDYGYGGYGGEAGWLDPAKLTELGFDLSRIDRHNEEYYTDTLPRDVLLVLELDGPAYRAALERAERHVARQEARLAASPKDTQIRNSAEGARKLLEQARARHSRLFVADAGLDRATLRGKYPDRARYAIVGGQVRIYRWRDNWKGADLLRGHVSDVNVDEIDVPLELRPVIARGAGFEAIVSYGRRLEPWFEAATSRPKPAPE
jgi:hypothetical protein